LRTLTLRDGPSSSDGLVTLLSHIPALTSLKLEQLEEVTSLAFLQELPKLAETLTRLTLDCNGSWSLTAADLPSLFVLQQLRELRLLYWSRTAESQLTAEDRAPFELRPCAVLPYLETFGLTR